MIKADTLAVSGIRTVREVPQILRDLRSLRVCVFHPRDQDGEGLTRQLERIGCQVQDLVPRRKYAARHRRHCVRKSHFD